MGDLAKRAVACSAWRWMAGMNGTWSSVSAPYKFRVASISRQGLMRMTLDDMPHTAQFGLAEDSRYLPDLTDPATLGCLLTLAREAAGEPGLTASRVGPLWRMTVGHGAWDPLVDNLVVSRKYPTEAEALVAALEAVS